jgi:hypothetical protein
VLCDPVRCEGARTVAAEPEPVSGVSARQVIDEYVSEVGEFESSDPRSVLVMCARKVADAWDRREQSPVSLSTELRSIMTSLEAAGSRPAANGLDATRAGRHSRRLREVLQMPVS